MIEWFKDLPQKSGSYLWVEFDDPHSCGCDMCEIWSIINWRPELRYDLGKDRTLSFVYQNNKGETLVIVWNRSCPSYHKGIPFPSAWAKFNYPPTFHVMSLS